MSSNLSSIGFRIESEKELHQLAEKVCLSAKKIESEKGTYFLWSSDCGAELWLQVNKNNELIGLNPHFKGSGVTRVGLTARISRPNDTELDGAYHGWANPQGEDIESGYYPFVFDCPDANCTSSIKLPQTVDVQIAAFAHEMKVYQSVEEYDLAQEGGMKYASKSFIPSGLFSPEGESTDAPEAMAIFSGEIMESKIKINPLSRHNFYWTKVSTLGGIFDVVADPEHITESIGPGGIISGSFWLSGRILNFQEGHTESFLKRLFWKS